MFTVGGAEFIVGGAVFTLGGAHNRTVGPPKRYLGRFFFEHSYFFSVSNDFSEQKRELKSVVHCPFKQNFVFYLSVPINIPASQEPVK